MTRDKIDILWHQAMNQAVKDGEMFTRHHFAALVAAAERERIAAEFDRRAVYSDGTPSSGWYEPHEPAEIVRGMK